METQRYPTRQDALEFAKRTRKNLQFVVDAAHQGEDVHVVTQVVNSLLGIVVFPWERALVDSVRGRPLAQLAEQGWPEWSMWSPPSEKATDDLWKLIYRLRNGVAHGLLRFSSDSRILEEVTIVVENRKRKGKEWEVVWHAEIRADHLRDFCYRFLDLVDRRPVDRA